MLNLNIETAKIRHVLAATNEWDEDVLPEDDPRPKCRICGRLAEDGDLCADCRFHQEDETR